MHEIAPDCTNVYVRIGVAVYNAGHIADYVVRRLERGEISRDEALTMVERIIEHATAARDLLHTVGALDFIPEEEAQTPS